MACKAGLMASTNAKMTIVYKCGRVERQYPDESKLREWEGVLDLDEVNEAFAVHLERFHGAGS